MMNLTCFNHYLIEYLLVSDDIVKDMNESKNIICSIDFLNFLNFLIDYDNEENYLSKKMRNNIKKLFAFLDIHLRKNKELFISIRDKYNDYPETGMYYLNQFLMKYDNVIDFKNNSCVLWKVKDIENSVRSDFGFMIMVLSDKKTYIEKYFSSLPGNQDFIYFIKRLLVQYPDIAYRLKDRIVSILELNEELGFDLDDNNTLLKKYKHLNKKNDYSTFKIVNFIEEYNKIDLEDTIVNNRKKEFNPLMFDYIKRFVDELQYNEFSKNMKDSLIDILSSMRQYLSKDLIGEYNDLLVSINSKQIGTLDKKTVISANHILQKYGLIEYLKIFVKFEIEDTSLGIESDKKIMDYILGDVDKEQISNYDECYASINRFIHENVSMFKDPYIYSKIDELLSYVLKNIDDLKLYNKTISVKKKIQKLN